MSSNAAYRIHLVADSTIDPLARFISQGRGDLAVSIAPYDQVRRVLEAGLDGCDLAVVLTQPDKVSAELIRALNYQPYDRDQLFAEIDSFGASLAAAASRVPAMAVFTWMLPSWVLPGGLQAFRPPFDFARILAECNLRLARVAEQASNLYVLDTAEALASLGPTFDPKLWAMGKVIFSRPALQGLAQRIRSAADTLAGRSRKLVVLDLDNTLWGGILGEVGWQNLTLGGIDPIGESYAIFQRQLKALRNRGPLLAIASKNDEATAVEAIRSHPEMVLKADDFAAWRINWQDKAENIADLARQLNLGLQSIVFIDDSPAERDRVRQALPEVLVPEWPADPAQYPQALRALDCFDSAGLSQEDLQRTQLYHQEQQRTGTLAAARSRADWLQTLQMQVAVEPLSEANLPRAAQLLNKTNQFNLATRRMTGAEFQQWACQPGHCVLTFRAQDRFGEYGLIGLLSLAVDAHSHTLRIVDWLVSCRTLGRGIEDTMLAMAAAVAKSRGCDQLVATYLPTAKNNPILEFLTSLPCAIRQGDDFVFHIEQCHTPPPHVQVLDAAAKEPAGHASYRT